MNDKKWKNRATLRFDTATLSRSPPRRYRRDLICRSLHSLHSFFTLFIDSNFLSTSFFVFRVRRGTGRRNLSAQTQLLTYDYFTGSFRLKSDRVLLGMGFCTESSGWLIFMMSRFPSFVYRRKVQKMKCSRSVELGFAVALFLGR